MFRANKRSVFWGVLALCLTASFLSAEPAIKNANGGLAASPGATLPFQSPVGLNDVSSAGSFSHTYSIRLPKGRGVEPSLAVQYSSSGGSGILGQGFALSGLGSVELDRSFPIQFSEVPVAERQGNHFVLNGQKLFLDNSSKLFYAERSFGAPDRVELLDTTSSTWDVSNAGLSPTSYWKVTRPNGVAYYYGSTADSRVEATGKAGSPRVWELSRVEDPNGNAYVVSYFKHAGRAYPERIVYSVNDTVSATGIKFHAVRFSYENYSGTDVWPSTVPQGDQDPQYIPTKVDLKFRLALVVITEGADRNGDAGRLVRKYHLSYSISTSSGNPLLTKVTEYGSDGNLPQTSDYLTDSGVFTPVFKTGSIITFDFELGDELSETAVRGLFQPTGATLPPLTYQWENTGFSGLATTPVTVPINGFPDAFSYTYTVDDAAGRGLFNNVRVVNDVSELWLSTKGKATALVKIMNGQKAETSVENQYWTQYYATPASNWQLREQILNELMAIRAADRGKLLVETQNLGQNNRSTLYKSPASIADINTKLYGADVNGDGQGDIVLVESNGNVSVRLCDASGGFPNSSVTPPKSTTSGDALSFGDLNGDGRADLIVVGKPGSATAGNVTVYASVGDGFGPQLFQQSMGLMDTGVLYWTPDFNGDGIVDLFKVNGSTMTLWLGTPNGFVMTTRQFPYTKDDEYYFTDLNGDHRPEFVNHHFNSTAKTVQIKVYYGTNNLAASMSVWTSPAISRGLYTRSLWTDNDGDGVADLRFVLIQDASPYNFEGISDYKTNVSRDLVVAVHNPQGGTSSVVYQKAHDFANAIIPANSAFPSVVNNSARWLALSTTASDDHGYSTPITTTYDYSNGKRYAGSPADRADLGFETVTKVTAGNRTVSTYDQTREKYGTVVRSVVAKVSSPGTIMIETATSYDLKPLSVSPLAKGLVPVQTLSSNYDGTSTPYTTKKTFDYDSFGNQKTATDWGQVTSQYSDVDPVDNITATTVYQLHPSLYIFQGVEDYVEAFNYYGQWVKSSWNRHYFDARGNETVTEAGPLSQTRVVKAFDGFGNLIQLWDANAVASASVLGSLSSNAGTLPPSTWGLGTQNASRTLSYDPEYQDLPTTVQEGGSTPALISRKEYGLGRMATASIDANGSRSTFDSDVFGRLVTATMPGETSTNGPSGTIITVYSDNVFPATVQQMQKSSASGAPVSFLNTFTYFDGLGRKIQTKRQGATAGQWITQDWTYDASGRNDQISVPRITSSQAYTQLNLWDWLSLAKTSTEYDIVGRIVKTNNPDHTSKITAYLRNVQLNFDENQHLTSLETISNKVIARTYSGVIQTFYSSDLSTAAYSTITTEKFAGLTQTTDSAGNITKEFFDLLGRRTKLETPDSDAGKSWNYTYDANGNLKTQTQPNGKVTTFFYDALNRLTDKTYSDTTPVAHYTYDLNTNGKGRVSSVTFGRGSDSYLYDIRGRVTTQTRTLDGLSRSLKYTYDSMDRKVSETLPTGESLVYEYGLDGNLKTLVGRTGYLTDAKYDPRGLVTQMDSIGGISRHYDYYDTTGETDAGWGGSLSQRLSAQDFQINGTTVVGLKYQYDRKGNLTLKTDTVTPDNTQSYLYDSLDRLEYFSSSLFGPQQQWQYDTINNITSFAGSSFGYQPTRPHVLASARGLVYSATYAGSQNDITDGTKFIYDAENRLVSTTDARGEAISYSYDAMRQRTAMEAGPRKTYYWFPNYEETYRGLAETDAAVPRDYPNNPAGRQVLTDAWSSGFTKTNLTTTVNSGIITAQRTSTTSPGYFSWTTSFSADKVKVVQIRARGVAGETLRVKVNSTFYLPAAILTPEWQIFTFDTSIPEWTGTITSLLAVLHMNGAAELDWVYVGDGITLPSTVGQAINAKSGAAYKQDDWNSTDNWVANGWEFQSLGSQTNLVARNGYLTVKSTTNDTWINKDDLNVSGANNPYVSLRVRQTAGSVGRRFNVYYATENHYFNAAYRVETKVPNTALNQWVTINLDMSNINFGGDDWIKSTIRALRFDFGEAAGESFDIDWIYVGSGATATQGEYPNNWLMRAYVQDSWNGLSGWTTSNLTATTLNGVVTLQRQPGVTGFFTKSLTIDTSANRVILFKARAANGTNKIRFKQGSPTNITLGGAHTLTSDWQTFTVDTSATSQWSGSVTSVQFALDMDGPVEIDWLYIGTGSQLAGDYPNDPVGTYYANHTWENLDGWYTPSWIVGQPAPVATGGSLTAAQSTNWYTIVQRDTAINASTTKKIAVKWRADAPVGRVSLYFVPTTPGVTMDETTQKMVTSTSTSGIVTFDMATVAKWKDTITTIRLDFGNAANPVHQVWIDWIYIGNGDSLSELDTWKSTVQANGVTLAERTADGLKYLVQDHLGSVVATTTETGVELGTTHYAPFGSMLEAARTPDRTTYTGQKWDSDSSLYYYNARYYNPELGRFTQPDPALWDGQLYGQVPLTLEEKINPYLYAMNNPVVYTDPTGLMTAEEMASYYAHQSGNNVHVDDKGSVTTTTRSSYDQSSSLTNARVVTNQESHNQQVAAADLAAKDSASQFLNGVATVSSALAVGFGFASVAGVDAPLTVPGALTMAGLSVAAGSLATIADSAAVVLKRSASNILAVGLDFVGLGLGQPALARGLHPYLSYGESLMMTAMGQSTVQDSTTQFLKDNTRTYPEY